MRLHPADVSHYYKYDATGCVGVEYYHKPTGCRSGMQPTHERADRMLREGITAWEGLQERVAYDAALDVSQPPRARP